MDTAGLFDLETAQQTNYRQKYQIEVEASGVQPNQRNQPN